jgi:choice-of-anchor C domain-containing protein
MKGIVAIGLTICTLTFAHAGNLLQNGSFEQNADGLVNPGITFKTLAGGSTYINGWTVTGNSIDYVNNYWQAADGNWSLDLSGDSAGGVQQTIKGLAKGVYFLSVDLSGNPDGGPQTKEMLVSWGSGDEDFAYTTGANTHANMMYHTMGTMFEWAGGDLTISFATDTTNFANQNTAYGPVLDKVSLTSDVDTPASPAALAMAVMGAGLAKRRRAAKAV